MAFTFTKNIKVGMQCSEGELVLEFRRPTKKDLNKLTAAKIDLKSEGEARLNEVDDMRLAFFDQFIEAIYIQKPDGKQDTVNDEDGQPIELKKIPDDVKSKAVLNAFELNNTYVKNL